MAEEMNSAEFRVGASDLKGHSVPVYFRAPGAFMYQISIILQSGKFPYQAKGEILRHALLRHLKWLGGLAPVKSVIAEAEAVLEILREEENAEMFAGIFEKIASRIAVYLGNGETGEAVRLVRIIQNRLMEMEAGYWKNKYVTELEQRWGYLLKGAKKASLADGMDDEED